MKTRSALAAALALTVAAASRDAFAGGAAELLKEGLALREKGSDKGALEKFAEADRISPSGETKAQMALAEQALGRWVEAEAHMKLALEDGSNSFVKRNRKALEAAATEMGKHVTTIELSAPDGVSVAVDDRDFAPLAATYRLPAGMHRFILRKEGFSDTPKDIECPGERICRESVSLLPKVKVEAPIGGGGGGGVRPADASSGWMRPAGIAIGAVGVVGLGVGVVLHERFEHYASAANANSSGGKCLSNACNDAAEDARSFKVPRAISYVAGGLLTATGVALFVAGAPKGSTETARVRCAPGLLSVGCAGTF